MERYVNYLWDWKLMSSNTMTRLSSCNTTKNITGTRLQAFRGDLKAGQWQDAIYELDEVADDFELNDGELQGIL